MIYNKANLENKLVEKYYEEVKKFDPLLGQIKTMKVIHNGGILYEQEKSKRQHKTDLIQLSSSTLIKRVIIEDYQIQEFSILFNEFINQQLLVANEMIVKETKRLSEFTGNIFQTNGKIPTYNDLIKIIEKIDISFDKKGNPVLPTIFCGTDLFEKMKSIDINTNQKIKYKKIIDNKRKEWYANKYNRKLSYIN